MGQADGLRGHAGSRDEAITWLRLRHFRKSSDGGRLHVQPAAQGTVASFTGFSKRGKLRTNSCCLFAEVNL